MLSFAKPEYLFRPSQILRRLHARPIKQTTVRLPWKALITVNPSEAIGRAIWSLGVYDLPVTETLWRLTDPGDVAVDAGANIGYMTAVLLARTPFVWSFEPHPDIYGKLAVNNARWAPKAELRQLALSDTECSANLAVNSEFDGNEGTAYISESGDLEIQCVRLDTVIESAQVLKIDVEGHELSVLQGAAGLDLRDIVFEEHGTPPTPVTDYLGAKGYSLFRIGQGTWGPVLIPLGSASTHAQPSWLPHNYLATCDPERALKRLAPKGWRSLSNR